MNRPIHFEILADDPDKLSAFYHEVLGWETNLLGGEQKYWIVKTGEGDSPGIDGGMMNRHFPQAVINTVQVFDIDRTLKDIADAGGKRVHGPEEIPGVGRHAYCADPEGNLFGVLQPLQG